MLADSTTADALTQRGFGLLAEGRAAEAGRAFRAAIAADPDHVQAHHGLVRALRDAGRLEGSIAAALALTVLTPQDPQAHEALALSLRSAGHLGEAETAAKRARLLEWKRALQSSKQEADTPHSAAPVSHSAKPEMPS